MATPPSTWSHSRGHKYKNRPAYKVCQRVAAKSPTGGFRIALRVVFVNNQFMRYTLDNITASEFLAKNPKLEEVMQAVDSCMRYRYALLDSGTYTNQVEAEDIRTLISRLLTRADALLTATDELELYRYGRR